MIFRLLFVCFFAVFITTCASGPGIPGERNLVVQNIASEYYHIGDAYFELKNYTKAAEYYKKVLKNPAFESQAKYKLARSYVFSKQWNNAVSMYRELIKADPNNTNLRMSLAYVLASSGDIAAALQMYDKMIDEKYFEPALLQNLVLLHLTTKNLEEAEKKIHLFKELFPEDDRIIKLEENLQKEKQPQQEKEDVQSDKNLPVEPQKQ